VCGARPIVFDAPHYRRWYEPWAEFIPEGSGEEVTNALIGVFERGPRPVTREERQEANYRFDWANIVPDFWKGVLR
jgi:hypothetical protein